MNLNQRIGIALQKAGTELLPGYDMTLDIGSGKIQRLRLTRHSDTLRVPVVLPLKPACYAGIVALFIPPMGDDEGGQRGGTATAYAAARQLRPEGRSLLARSGSDRNARLPRPEGRGLRSQPGQRVTDFNGTDLADQLESALTMAQVHYAEHVLSESPAP